MILMRFLPEILKEMLKNVPTLLFDVVDWKELTQVLPMMSKRILAKDLASPLISQIAPSLKSYQIQFSDELSGSKTTDSTEEEKQTIASSLLKTYFQQLFNPQGQLLDFRADFFSYENHIIFWKPNGLWAVWKDEFRLGLIEVYKGFYSEDEKMFRSGLKSIGLIQENWDQNDQDEMAQLFKNHFKSSLGDKMHFNIEDFKKSFINIFHFLLEKKVKMSADFMYLGMMLVTLYLHLEELKIPLSVKEIFTQVMQLNED
jgi:predicted unusual protein kinase regulating ubiquinone biosynthesis (AarF/ABC1/UbiB family)